jgi:hypothetical protein
MRELLWSMLRELQSAARELYNAARERYREVRDLLCCVVRKLCTAALELLWSMLRELHSAARDLLCCVARKLYKVARQLHKAARQLYRAVVQRVTSAAVGTTPLKALLLRSAAAAGEALCLSTMQLLLNRTALERSSRALRHCSAGAKGLVHPVSLGLVHPALLLLQPCSRAALAGVLARAMVRPAIWSVQVVMALRAVRFVLVVQAFRPRMQPGAKALLRADSKHGTTPACSATSIHR